MAKGQGLISVIVDSFVTGRPISVYVSWTPSATTSMWTTAPPSSQPECPRGLLPAGTTVTKIVGSMRALSIGALLAKSPACAASRHAHSRPGELGGPSARSARHFDRVDGPRRPRLHDAAGGPRHPLSVATATSHGQRTLIERRRPTTAKIEYAMAIAPASPAQRSSMVPARRQESDGHRLPTADASTEVVSRNPRSGLTSSAPWRCNPGHARRLKTTSPPPPAPRVTVKVTLVAS